MQYDGPDHKQLDRTLAGFANHPNVAAYILVGLGLRDRPGVSTWSRRRTWSRSAQLGRREGRGRPRVLNIQE